MPARPQRSAAPNQVRIIGGRWRRRILRFPPTTDLRPTPDRVRETLFNWLGQDLSRLVTLDLFAGSGALSFESLSRGARQAVAVDASAAAISAIRRNATLLGASSLELHRADAFHHLMAERRQFDVIFIDPPFSEAHWMPRLWPLLPARLNLGGWVYIEQPRLIDPPPDWSLHRHQTAGSVHYHLLRHEPSSGTAEDNQPRANT